MPWCPIWESEFREGFKKCPQCDVELTDTKAPIAEEAESSDVIGVDSERVMIMSFGDQKELEMACELLNRAEIPFEIKDPGTGSYLKLVFGTTCFGTELYTTKKHARRAMALLRFFDKDTEKEEYSDDAINDAYEEFMDQTPNASAEKTEQDTDKSGNGAKTLGIFFGLFVGLLLALYLFIR